MSDLLATSLRAVVGYVPAGLRMVQDSMCILVTCSADDFQRAVDVLAGCDDGHCMQWLGVGMVGYVPSWECYL